MTHDIILTFAGGLGAALILGYIAQRIGISPIVGYLLAGIVVGPHTPGFVANQGVAEQFAEIGIILLMFGVGLRFHLHELLAVWKVAMPGALVQSLASTALVSQPLQAGPDLPSRRLVRAHDVLARRGPRPAGGLQEGT